MNILIFLSLLLLIFILFRNRNQFVYTYIFTLFWFVNLTVSELFFTGYKFSNSLYVLIITSSIFTLLGEFIGYKPSKIINNTLNFNLSRYKILFWITFCIALCFPIINLFNNGISLLRLLDLQSLLEVNNEMAIARYSNELETSILGQFCLIFVYFLPFFSSLLIEFHNKKKYIYYSIIPGLLVILTQNTKLVFMSSLLSALAGFIVQSIVLENKLPRIKVKTIMFCVIGFVLFYGLMVFSFIARIGRFDEKAINIANSKIASYVAHMPALNYWLLNTNFDDLYHTFGVKTFYGISNTLGIAERKSGVFKDYFVFHDNGEEYQTNIYTVFRFLIEDFGFTGTMFFFLILAFLFALIRSSSNVVLKMTVLSMLIFFIFNSYVASVWTYFSYILAYVVLYISIKFVLDFKLKLL